MATLTFQMASTPLTGSKTFNGSDQDMQDLLDWAKVAYDGVIQELYNPSGNTQFSANSLQIGVALATATKNAWVDAVKKFKKDEAVAAVPDPTPSTWS